MAFAISYTALSVILLSESIVLGYLLRATVRLAAEHKKHRIPVRRGHVEGSARV